ncbi:glycerophosphodiester phosphodiesterase family protein [Paenibacillus sp. P36]|uniref:glycerophosphodiester phosphodiesterase family protein n=1 Tax=Paenibacillus sp. P36 TaxID=3342538 RepID=UPI0038B40402
MKRKYFFIVVGFCLLICESVSAMSINGDYKGNPIVKLFVNGKSVVSEVPPIILDDKTMIPIRGLSESLGAQIKWNSSTNTVNVFKQDPSPLYNLIPHAGGGIGGYDYTETQDAFEASLKKGFKILDCDIQKTTDGKYILLHEWDNLIKLAGTDGTSMSHAEFMNLKFVNGYQQMDLDMLYSWLLKHPDIHINIDVKRNTPDVEVMKEIVFDFFNLIEEKYPEIKNQIIVQVYRFEEFGYLSQLGYVNMFFNLGAYKLTDDQVVENVQKYNFKGVYMGPERTEAGLPNRLKAIGVPTYVYTINDPEEVIKLTGKGAYGFITDYLVP